MFLFILFIALSTSQHCPAGGDNTCKGLNMVRSCLWMQTPVLETEISIWEIFKIFWGTEFQISILFTGNEFSDFKVILYDSYTSHKFQYF